MGIKENDKFEVVEVSMIKFCNYLDIPSEMKDAVLEQLLQIEFLSCSWKTKDNKKRNGQISNRNAPTISFCVSR